MKWFNKILILALSGVLIWSCTDLDTVPEGGVLTSEQDQETSAAIPERVAAKITGMFSSIATQYYIFGSASSRDDDCGFPAVCLSQDLNGPDMVGDNSGYNWFTVSSDYSDRSDTYANPFMRYAVFYYQMKLANDVLASIPVDTDNEQLLIYKAQAQAVRAFDYLGLVPYFQYKYKGNEDAPAVPIVTNDMVESPANNPRATLKDVYALIISDLTDAIDGLEGYTRSSKSEIDQKVAYGLRARANLYMENWADAASDAAKALEGYTPYSRTEVSAPTFISANDHNWMWALIITPANMPDPYPSWPSVLGSFSGDSYTAGVGCYKAINKLLFDLIPSTDVRKGWWVDENLHSNNLATVKWGGVTGDAVAALAISDVKLPFTPYTNIKFGQYGGPGSTTNAGDWCIMRAEELILIQAEATAKAGNEAGGKQLLESFVKTYRNPSYSVPSSRSFQDEVWFQRRIELWGEGFSMSDIMRLGKNVVRFKTGVESNFPEVFQFNIPADDGWLLMRFPQRETNTNSAIVNNDKGTLPVSGQGAGLKDGITD
jgi:hypothetical protein